MARIEEQLQPDEQVLYQARPSKLGEAGLILLMIGSAIATGVLYYFSDEVLILFAGIAITLLIGVILSANLLMLRTNEYVLTNHRVVRQTGFFAKKSMDTYLDKINNVEHSQTALGRIFGFGDVEIDSASETGTARFASITNPLAFKHAIQAASQQVRTGMSRGAVAAPATPAAERLRQAKALLDEGLIDAEEYAATRAKLVGEL